LQWAKAVPFKAKSNERLSEMVIEWLKIHVPAAKQDAYLFHDKAIWSETLSRYPGYIGKTVWHEPAEPDYLVLIISWHSLRQWKAVPQDVLEATDARMLAAMGELFEIVEGKHFDTVN
jgi:uncharacterized protein (TIGR03792 family)